MSTFLNTVLLILESSLQCFPCYLVSKVNHFDVFLSQFATKKSEDGHLLDMSCYKHIYMLLSCSCAFDASLFPKEYVKTPSECTILKVILKIDLDGHAPYSASHAFRARSTHPTTSPTILLRGNCVVCCILFKVYYCLCLYSRYNMHYTSAKVILVFQVQDNI